MRTNGDTERHQAHQRDEGQQVPSQVQCKKASWNFTGKINIPILGLRRARCVLRDSKGVLKDQ